MGLHHTLWVELGEQRYPIYLGAGLLDTLGATCRRHAIAERIVVLADRNSAAVAMKRAVVALRAEGFTVSTLVMPPGERQKNPVRARALHTALLRQALPRASALIALGGGVVGDVGGYVASTYRRGIAFVQVPTTLLSQVDSSVGGKNGVNHPLGKNAIGTYHQPRFVLSDVDLLATLPRREVIAGLGEILKYPLVGDPGLFDFIEQHLDDLLAVRPDAVLEVATRCLRIKTALVSQDERELLPTRGRVVLNVGHAVGHALETLSQYRLRHGEAILLGILAEGRIAVERTGFAENDLARFAAVYRRLGRRYSLEGISDGAIERFTLGKGHARFVLPGKMGEAQVLSNITPAELQAGLRYLRNL